MSTNKFVTIYTLLFIVFILQSNSIAKGFRVAQLPNGSKFSCNTCHTSGGGTPRNDFGKLVEKSFLNNDNVVWGPLLASLDSDNDGATNGQELQDPFGLWMVTDPVTPAPGDLNMVTSAGLSSSSPLTTLTVNFSGMGPHVGQQLWLRVYDKNDMREVGRTSVSITESFSVNLDVILPGHSYNVDFFADHNGNGHYDSPPVDHAWRSEIDNAQSDPVVDFLHNTDFVDIDWPNLLTINFTSMTPHMDQLLEIRVEDDLTSHEVGRTRIEFIPSAEFSVHIPGIEMGKEYNIEMYADLNKNGLYDAPPVDHAWELKIDNTTGDFVAEFSHNTDFKDIGWKYLYSLNFSEMTPHVGQNLEMRIVRTDNSEEVDRVKINIETSEFTLSIPQIEMDHDYNVDFYADLNGNDSYDAPPMDHAWRLSFNSNTGNFVQNFSHNTDFVDIGWNNVTAVDENVLLPSSYVLNQNYPNPFNPTTTISFNLDKSEFVNLIVYDILGQVVTTLINRKMTSGLHEISFNANNLQSGTYYYRINTDNHSEVKKMVLLK